MDVKVVRRKNIHYRIRKKIVGSAQKPRLSVFRSNKDLYVQLIDDENGNTLLQHLLHVRKILQPRN